MDSDDDDEEEEEGNEGEGYHNQQRDKNARKVSKSRQAERVSVDFGQA